MAKFEDMVDHVAEHCAGLRVRLLNRVVSGLYDDHLRPLGLRGSQFNILVASAKMKLARPAIMAEVLCIDPTTLSRNLERMRARGWLELVPDPEDGRAQPFRLTDAGREILRKAIPLWERAQAETEALLGEAALAAIRRGSEAAQAG